LRIISAQPFEGIGFLRLGPDPAVDIEPRVAPGKKAFCPFRTVGLRIDLSPHKIGISPAPGKSQELKIRQAGEASFPVGLPTLAGLNMCPAEVI